MGDVLRRRQLAFQRLGQGLGDFIGGHADGLAGVVQGVFHNRAALLLAQDDADGGVLVLLADLPVQRRQIKLHLADELRQEFADFQFNGDKAAQTAVKQQEVDEKLFAVHLQPVLAAHEGEHAAHGPEEILDPGDERPLQLPLAVLLAQLQKIEGVFVLHRQLGLGAKFRRQRLVEVGLAQQGFFIALVVDLVNEDILGPAELAGHAQIEFPLQRVLAALQDGQVVAPADFSHQWCEFFESGVRLEKGFHPPEVGSRKAAHAGKLRPQIGGELFHHRLAPAFNILPLHDHPPDVPVQADQLLVDRLEGFILGGADALLDLGQQARVVLRFAEAVFWGFVSRFHPCPPRHQSRHRPRRRHHPATAALPRQPPAPRCRAHPPDR